MRCLQQSDLLRFLAIVPAALGLLNPTFAGDLNPGSLLVFPLVDNNPGLFTVLTVTNTDRTVSGGATVEFSYRESGECMETTVLETLTPADTLTVAANAHSPSTIEGFAYVWVVSDTTPIRNALVKDCLIGTSNVVDAVTQSIYSVNALSFQGIGDGTVTDLDGDGERDLDGVEYSAVPDRLVFPRFFGEQAGTSTDLVLINLGGGVGFQSTVDFFIYNDNESLFSAEYTFTCWERFALTQVSGLFGNSFLATSSNDDPDEIVGQPSQESGWFEVDGAFAATLTETVVDPALLGCLIETVGNRGGASLPFGLGTQSGGSLLGEDPCEVVDLLEPNNSCAAAAPLPSPGEYTVNGLTVQRPLTSLIASVDFYEVSVPGNHQVKFDVNFSHAEANIDARLFESCSTLLQESLSMTDGESVSFLNLTSTPTQVQLQVLIGGSFGSDCGAYSLDVSIVPDPCLSIDDPLEDNDSCFDALPRGANSSTGGLRCLQGDSDWWYVDVPAGSTQTVEVLHSVAQADLLLAVRSDCSGGLGNLLALEQTTDDDESFTFTNTSTSSERFYIGVSTFTAATGICSDYSLVLSNTLAPGTIVPYCFGDGSLVNCPCGNNSSSGHPGGCAHANGDGAVLAGTGAASLTADSLHLDLTSGVPSSFALLVSAVNPLPQIGCIGCGIPEFDGLRCAGGDLRRHGTRSIGNGGMAGQGWGGAAPPAGGLGLASNAVAGQTRRYFAFMRTDLSSTCFTGQNSSNGVAVTWTP